MLFDFKSAKFLYFLGAKCGQKMQKKQQRGASLTPRGRKQRDLLDGNAVPPFGAGASLPERPHRLRPAGVSKASMTYIYLESQKHKNFWSNP